MSKWLFETKYPFDIDRDCLKDAKNAPHKAASKREVDIMCLTYAASNAEYTRKKKDKDGVYVPAQYKPPTSTALKIAHVNIRYCCDIRKLTESTACTCKYHNEYYEAPPAAAQQDSAAGVRAPAAPMAPGVQQAPIKDGRTTYRSFVPKPWLDQLGNETAEFVGQMLFACNGQRKEDITQIAFDPPPAPRHTQLKQYPDPALYFRRGFTLFAPMTQFGVELYCPNKCTLVRYLLRLCSFLFCLLSNVIPVSVLSFVECDTRKYANDFVHTCRLGEVLLWSTVRASTVTSGR